MRYDDASGSFSAATGAPDARDDADALPAGSHGPATGNTITGAGTITGLAGADLVTDGAGKIVALEGAGGSDTSDGGSLHVGGRFGELTMDAQGNYRYQPNAETPDGARDVFRYTLADNAGARDAATLTIEIGREPKKIDANAQQLVPGPDGVITLPPGVQLSDIHVVGRNLVIDMPDGTQMVIIDGAVFVPQLVLNGVEVPATNLAALLIDAEPQPAAGIPQSSGGNFDIPVPPLDPGVPLGDLIPPTELSFTDPIFEDVGQDIDREPEAGTVSVQLDDDAKAGGNPGGPGDDPDSVNPSGFLPGSGGDGALTWDLSSGGAPAGFSYVDGPNGSILVQQVQGAITVTVLTITVNAATGAYTVVQNAAILHPTLDGQAGDNTENNVSFTVGYTVTDSDGDSAPGTITIDVDDDTPTVNVTAGSDANVILTTHDAATIGAASEAVSTSANFGGVFTGTTVSSGADGAGIGTSSGYALSTTGGASGLTQGGVAINLYNVSGVIVGSTAATAGAIDASNTVFTVSTTNTGIVTLTQFSQIDHTNADPSPTGAPFIDHIISLSDGSITLTRSETVIDRDGDTVTGSASVGIGANLRFVDDGPTISLADRGEDQLIVDETNLNVNATGNFAANFSANFGADGPAVGGGIGYTLGINAGATGLVDTLSGQAVVLSVVGGQVVGTAGVGGPVVFTVSVDGSGVVTLDQQRAVVHDDPTDHDESGVSAATLNADNLVTLTATATDRDGDTASQTINIGQNLHFEDDGPNVSNLTAGAGVLLDETTGAIAGAAGGMTPISATSASAVISATSAFGADGPAAIGATVYGLSLSGGGATVASGLQTAVGDFAITLNLVDSTHITGTYNGSNVAFTITMNANGTITVEQNVPLEHLIDGSSAAAHDDSLDLVLDGEVATNLVNATITIKDGDGDTATGSVGIGNLIVFEDDGPSIDVTAGADSAVLLQTQDADTIGGASDTAASTANFSGVFGLTSAGGADGAAGAPVLNYTLGVSASGVDSGLDQGGASIFLYVISGKVVGSTSAVIGGVNAGNTVFDVAVAANGVVTLTQYSQIDHPIAGDPTPTVTPFVDHILSMADGLVTLTASSTVTDNDGDTATDSAIVNIGANLQFADDGPDISAVLTGTQIRIDETDGVVAAGGEVDPVGGNLGTVTMSAVSLFTVSNVHVSADAPTTNSYALTLSSQGVASGLLLSTTNAPIFLYNISGVISGSTSATLGGVNAGNTVFTVSIDTGTGAITLTQFFAVEHGTPGASYDEDSSGLNAGVLNVTITATDFDGDTDSASVDLGSVIRFEDDGPSVNVTAGSDSAVLLQTQDAETIGAATDTASSSANFGGVFGLTSAGGSDGAATTPSLSYVLGVPGAGASGVDSGLDQTGANIYLYVIAGKVVGSTSATLAGVTVGNTVFDVGVSGTGVVTLTQYSQIDHPIAGDPTPTITPFADHIISLTDNLVTLTANASITDNDGDIAVDSETVNIGANLQFADHGPIATNDTDSIAPGFFGTATGNVLTGVEVAVPEDANGTDGSADNVGADTPGTITLIASNNIPANTDNTADGSGNFVVAGQYGVLTINANGDYSYDRNDGSAGGVSDVFTYTLRDFDGDTVTATLTINIGVNPPVAGTETATVDDDGLVGSPDGVLEVGNGDINANLGETPATNTNEAIYNGTLNVTGGDGDVDFSLIAPANQTIGQETVSYSLVANVLTATIATSPDATRVGDTLFTVSLDPETGNYVVTLVDNVLHNNDANENEDGTEVSVNISYQVVDVGGNPSATPGTLTIQFNDDTPRATAALLTGTVDEDGVLEGAANAGPGDGIAGGTDDVAGQVVVATGSVATLFTAGADAPLTYSLSAVTAALTAQGLTSGGVALTYGVVGDTLTASAGVGNTVFTFQLLANGNYTFTLVDQLDHLTLNGIAGDNTENDLTIQLGSIIQATDADGDTVAAVTDADSGLIITVDDDSPTLGTIQPGTANNLPGSAVSVGTLHFEIGADETATSAAAVSNITVNVNGATSGGKAIVTNYSNGVLTAYQDVGPAGYDAGDTTVVFTLTVDPYAATSGQYTFDLVTPLDPVVTPVLIGGSSSFGAGPTGFQILTSAAGQDLSVISGYLADESAVGVDGDGTFNAAAWLATGVLVAGDINSAGVNGSTSGWGVDNNNFETAPGDIDELVFFDFGSQATADPDAGGPFVPPVQGPDVVGDPPEVQMPNISFATFEFINYTSGAGDAGDDIAYVVHYTNGTFTSGFVPDASIDGALWTHTAPSGLFIADIQFYSGLNPSGTVQSLPPGKIDLVSVGVESTSLDVDLDFTVTLTDYDGDIVSGAFTINVDQANSPSVAIPPVALDLNGDGVTFIGHDAGVTYDYDGDGVREATAWVGADDGILVRDANGNGTVDNASEFVFGGNGLTDLQALAVQYGSALDANDADFARFAVWQDANSNGVSDAGELVSLTAAGIASISLVSDGVSYSAANGDVTVVGTGSYTNADGSTGALADAIFKTGTASLDDQRAMSAANNNSVLLGAIAAAGLGSSVAAAAHDFAPAGNIAAFAVASIADGGGLVQSSALDDSDVARSALAGETQEAVEDQPQGDSSSQSAAEAGQNSLTDGDSHESAAPTALLEGTEASDQSAPEQSSFTSSGVGMPSAEMLAAANANDNALEGQAQSTGEVGRVLFDALAGGGHGPNIDAVIDAVANQAHGGQAALDALASHGPAAVSGWDMASFAGFTGGSVAFTMEHMVHVDAAPPAA